MSGFRKNMQRLSLLSILIVAVATLIVAPASAHAQVRRSTRRESNANRKARIERSIEETYSHRYELFGGGGYLRFRSGEHLQRNNEITWATSASYFLNPKLGITAAIGGAYGNAKVGNTFANVGNPLITEYTFTGGPSYRLYAKQKFAVTASAGGGVALGNFDGGSKGIPAPQLGMWATSNRPVIYGSVSVDYNFYPNLALRVTPTYLGTFFRGNNVNADLSLGAPNGSIQNNIGFNAGIVYRFGKINKK